MLVFLAFSLAHDAWLQADMISVNPNFSWGMIQTCRMLAVIHGRPKSTDKISFQSDGALVITCFPSVGMVTSVVGHYLIEHLELEQTGELIKTACSCFDSRWCANAPSKSVCREARMQLGRLRANHPFNE